MQKLRLLGLSLVLAGIVLATGAHAARAPQHAVASFSILGDMVAQVGGDLVTVKTLVGPDGDAHGYQPTPEDLKAVATADIIVVNGLGLDQWMSRLINSAGAKAVVVTATQGIVPLHMQDETGKRDMIDPHAWQNLANGLAYVDNIAEGLGQIMPDARPQLEQRRTSYKAEIAAMDRDVHAQLDGIPIAQRMIITSHDAFGYFGKAYGVRFMAPYGVSTESEPSAADIVRLIDQVKKIGAREIFVENMSNPRLVTQLAADAQARIGGTLYSDALSEPGGPAATYLDMFRNNVPKLKASMLTNHGSR